MQTRIAALVLTSMLLPALAEDLDQRRTLLVEDDWMARVVIDPLTPDVAKPTKKASGTGVAHFHGGLGDGPIVVKRVVRRGGKKIRYRVKPEKGGGIRVKGTIRTVDEGDGERLVAVSLRLRGKAPRRRIKGVDGARLRMHDAALTVPAFEDAFFQVLHDRSAQRDSAVAQLAIASNGECVAVGHTGVDGDRSRVGVLRATRWTVRPGGFVDETFLGPDAGVARGVSPDGRQIVGRMDFLGETSTDALWIDGSDAFHVTQFGETPSEAAFEATRVAGSLGTELIASLRIVTGGIGYARWSNLSGLTVLSRPGGTLTPTVHDMNASGTVLVGDVAANNRLQPPIALVWDAAGSYRVLTVPTRIAASVRAVSPDGRRAAGFTVVPAEDDVEDDQHVVWDLTELSPMATPFRERESDRSDVGLSAGPRGITNDGLVVGWDNAGSFIWQPDWQESRDFRSWLIEQTGLSLPPALSIRERVHDVVQVVGGHVFVGTSFPRAAEGDVTHWLVFVPTRPD